MIKNTLNKYTGILLFVGALLIGLNTYKDYGISWDEGSQRSLGLVTYNYVFHGNDSLRHFDNNVYGVGFELPLVILEKAFNLKDTRTIFLMRHLLTHLFFLLGALAFFLLIDYLYHNKLLATIGFLLLMVNPLIYGHSFFNTKDVPFLSMFSICFLLTAIAFTKNTKIWYIVLGLACGLLTNIRIMGILLIGCIWLFFALDYFKNRHDKEVRKKIVGFCALFTLAAFALLYITWPYLYNNPAQNFVTAFKRMSKYPWKGNVLFWGHIYKSTQTPWYYAISWFCISNPLFYLGLGVIGLILFAIKFCKNPKKYFFDRMERNHALFAFCFVEPLLAVLAFHSVLYDSWRQLFFIYPPFILMAIFGISYLFKTKIKWPLLLVLVASIGYTSVYMVHNYPFEHVYFNRIAGSDNPGYLRNNFETDYWGTSYKQALEYIVKIDTSHHITVAVNGLVGKENAWILPAKDRSRIVFKDTIADAKYYATFYRTHLGNFPYQNKEVFCIKVMNSRIMSVFKLK